MSDFDSEGHRARAQNVDDAEVPELDVKAELFEHSGVPASRHFGLILTVRTCTRYLARRPHRGRRVRPSQFHGHHLKSQVDLERLFTQKNASTYPVFPPVLDVEPPQRNVPEVEVALD